MNAMQSIHMDSFAFGHISAVLGLLSTNNTCPLWYHNGAGKHFALKYDEQSLITRFTPLPRYLIERSATLCNRNYGVLARSLAQVLLSSYRILGQKRDNNIPLVALSNYIQHNSMADYCRGRSISALP